MTNKRRSLTDVEQSAANKLTALYREEKTRFLARNKKLSHEKIAGALNWATANAVSQYMNGNIPLNLEAACKFATFFGVGVGDISPELEALLPPENRRPKEHCPLCDEEVDLSAKQLQLLTSLIGEMAPKQELSWKTI